MGRLTFGLAVGLLTCLLTSCASLKSEAKTNPMEGIALASIHGFQHFISPVDGDRCMMRPSCSTYAERAIRKHGLFMGWIMACDRLLRCGHDELYRSEIQILGGETYCLDPVENNDFWWSEGRP
jgi:uncharacterized protein